MTTKTQNITAQLTQTLDSTVSTIVKTYFTQRLEPIGAHLQMLNEDVADTLNIATDLHKLLRQSINLTAPDITATLTQGVYNLIERLSTRLPDNMKIHCLYLLSFSEDNYRIAKLDPKTFKWGGEPLYLLFSTTSLKEALLQPPYPQNIADIVAAYIAVHSYELFAPNRQALYEAARMIHENTLIASGNRDLLNLT